jgi:hypothetical protein
MTALNTGMNEKLRELTVAELDVIGGGARNYDFTILGIHFWGWTTDGRQHGCAAWDDGNGGRTGVCY